MLIYDPKPKLMQIINNMINFATGKGKTYYVNASLLGKVALDKCGLSDEDVEFVLECGLSDDELVYLFNNNKQNAHGLPRQHYYTLLQRLCLFTKKYPALNNLIIEILESGTHIDETNNENGSSALQLVIRRMHNKSSAQTLKILIKYGADPNITDYYNETPVHHAVKNNNKEGLKILLDSYADKINLDVYNYMDNSPLHLAVQQYWEMDKYDVEIIEMLLEAGADPNLCTQDEPLLTPLQEYFNNKSIKAGSIELVKVFSSYRVDFNILDHKNRTILHLITKKKFNPITIELIKLLISLGIDTTVENNYGKCALDYLTMDQMDLLSP